MRRSKIISLVAALGILSGAAAHADAAPRRVVSVNLCTDQLALMLADPGQVIAVTRLAQNPRTSAMAEAAAAVAAPPTSAEDIYLQQPDLVLAGVFSDRATIAMLKRLGMRVELFSPAYSLDDVRARILQMGDALGHPDRAAALVAEFDAGLAALAQQAIRPQAALYYANGYTSGDKSLAGQILRAGGFDNVAEALGHGAIGKLPLEVLAMAAPEVVVTGQPYPGASRAEGIMDHPVVKLLKRGRETGTVTDRDWVCGTPHILNAINDMRALRDRVAGARP